MNAQDKYNEYLIQLINMGYGNYTVDKLPLEHRLKHNELEFLSALDSVEKGHSVNYLLLKFVDWYKIKYNYILNKHCRS